MNTLYTKFPFLWKIRKSIRFYRGQTSRLKKCRIKLETLFYKKEEQNDIQKQNECIIMMIDGRFSHGGLTDRLRGCLSIYSYCKQKNIPFYINFHYPFKLTDYLIPNKYNWYVNPNDISYNIYNSKPLVLDCYDAIGERLYDLCTLNLFRLRNKNKAIHLYSNIHFNERQYSQLFHELFKPTTQLQEMINFHYQAIGNNYISATFRFQQLLGDFKEGNPDIYPILPPNERKQLIDKCRNELLTLIKRFPTNQKVLVTSDSITFLNEISHLKQVYVIPGEIVHMNFESPNTSIFAKSFLDLFLIKGASKVFLFKTDKMYNSGFPKFAAMIGNKTFINHTF